jgi:threonine synthase
MMRAEALRCLRCAAEYPVGRYFLGCPACRARGKPTNLAVTYAEDELRQGAARSRIATGPGIWRYRDLLPVQDQFIVTVHEGGTPLVAVPRLGRRLGIPNLYVKDESRNPTGSFKDRLAAAAVSMARQLGMSVIVGSSSGNAGAATAALAAKAGMPCVMFTTKKFPLAMRVQMAVYGTCLIAAPTIADRWLLVAEGVERLGWFPVTVFSYPYFGSSCYGIEGYKTIGYEIADQLGRAPDDIVVPVGAGDAFSGTWKGLSEYHQTGVLDRLPRMHAAEVYGPLQHALADDLEDCVEMPTEGPPSVAVSVGSNLSTYQALRVLRQSGGSARSASNDQMLQAQRDLAALEGLYVETSSALSVAVLPQLLSDGAIQPDATVVAVLTSSGLKDPETTAAHMAAIPECTDTLESALAVLSSDYGLDLADPQPASR